MSSPPTPWLEAIPRALARRPGRWLALGAALVAVLALAPGLARLSTDNSPSIFFVDGAPATERYLDFRQTFGSDKAVRLVADGPALWTPAGLEALKRLEREAAAVDGVATVSGLWSHATGGDAEREWPPGEPQAFRQRMLGDPLARNLGWVGEDGAVATVLVTLEATDNATRSRILGALEDGLAGVRESLETEAPGEDLHLDLVGGPVLDRALDASTQEIGRRFFPLLVILGVVLLALALRRLAAVWVPLAFVGVAEVVTLGVLGWSGERLNLVLAVLPPLLFVIALATAVHVLVRYRDFRQEATEPAEAVRATYRDKGWAVLWTGVTTLVGFGSLALSQVGPVRDLGLWAALGMTAMTLLAFLVYPALLPAADQRAPARRPFEEAFQRRGRAWARWAARHRHAVLLAAGLTALAALAGAPRLEVETNALHYLEPEHPVRSAIEGLEARGVGTATLEVVLTLPADGGEPFTGVDGFRRLGRVAESLRQVEGVLGAVSVGDFLAAAERRAPGGPLMPRAVVRRNAYERLRTEAGDTLERFVTTDGRRARIMLWVPTVGAEVLQPLERRTRETALAALEDRDATVTTTGEFPLVVESQTHLLETLAWSLGLTLLVVAVILRTLLPSYRLTLLALAPNLWPVIGVLGIMGWFGLPLDVATVMVASVVLGLAVDDTIHTLGHFRELAPQVGRYEAVAGTLERTAASYVLTGVILGAGFGVCALSDFAPTARFGVLSAAAIALAVIGDLFLLPALLGSTPESVVERMKNKKAGSEG